MKLITIVQTRIVSPAAAPTAAPAGASQPSPHGLRIALVGGGKMGENHARAINRASTPARLVAVADPSVRARAALGSLVPGLAGFGAVAELLANAEVDIVHVCTPPSTHAA